MKRLLFLPLILILLLTNNIKAQPTADFDVTDTICLGEFVNFTDLSTCNGCNIVTWSWDLADGSVSGAQNPGNIYGAPGVYAIQLIVTDNNGIADTVTQNLVVIHCLGDIVVDYTNPCCPMLDAGPGFSAYLWSTGETTQTVQTCSSGLYQVTVMDGLGNQSSDTVTVTATASPPTIVLDGIVDINCLENNAVGSIETHAQGGTPGYTFVWNGQQGQSATLDSIAQAGTYTLTVYDALGCSDEASYAVSNTSNLYVSTNSTPANCGDNGTAWVTAQSNNPPYMYMWSDPNFQVADTASSLSGGVYYVTVIDQLGCQTTGSVTVQQSCFNVIKGRVYDDQNQNCIQDPGEPGISGRVVYSGPTYRYAYTDSLGDFTIHTPDTDPTVFVYYTNSLPFISPTCPSNGEMTLSFSQLGDTLDGNNFGFYHDPNAFDLDIHPGWHGAHPGFDKDYWILFGLSGYVNVDASLRFVYDPALTYLSCTQNGVHDAANHTIHWDYPNYQPQGWNWTDRPRAYFNVPATMEITDTLCSYFELLPITGDIDPSNNTLDICEPVTGSRDPNAKDVIPAGVGEEGFILPEDTVLFYTVHFQNNGNDTAFTVVVKDTLSAFVDPATIVPGAASHPYSFDLSGPGVLTFRFDAILLPDSTTNEPESHGYFNYTVKLKPNLPLGTVIENTAAIYFDFNEPIITNTTVNTIYEPLSVAEREDDAFFALYPNPTTGQFVLDFGHELNAASIAIYDRLGRQVDAYSVSNTSKTTIDLNGPAGIYLVVVRAEGEVFTQRVVKE